MYFVWLMRLKDYEKIEGLLALFLYYVHVYVMQLYQLCK